MKGKIRNNWVILLLLFTCSLGFGQVKMHYTVSFVEPEKHYAEVQLNYNGLEDAQIVLELPVWSPGYYKILDFPKYIVDFKAQTASGKPLEWNKTSKNAWEVKNGVDKDIMVTYRVFANHKSVAESNINKERAFLMPNTLFMHPKDGIDNAVSVTFMPYQEWNTISTGLQTTKSDTYYAKNFDVLYDSPVYIGNHKTFDFEFDDKKYHLGIAASEGLKENQFIADLKKIIAASTNLMKHVPYENYAFIMMEAGGGGLEHWNSQAVFTSGSFDFKTREQYTDFLNFITHEYFHLYNVKAIRPIELGPFDYSRENYTDMLWVSEGVTVYYEYLLMMRAGLLKPQEAMDYLSSSIRRYENIEGNKHMSLSRSSFDIWLNFLSREENSEETTISYYNKGPIIGFLLDLEIRHSSNNQKSFDDVMRFLYSEYYLKQERGFKKEEFWAVCEEMAGRPLQEIQDYVDTVKDIDYQKYLDYAGLEIDMDQLEGQTEDSKPVKRSYRISEKKKSTKKQRQIRDAIFPNR